MEHAEQVYQDQKKNTLFEIEYKSLVLKGSRLQLQLKREFKTSHAASSTRTNFLIHARTTKRLNIHGIGEAGLPKKVPGIYLADIDDCLSIFAAIKPLLPAEIESQKQLEDRLFQGIDRNTYWRFWRQQTEEEVYHQVLQVLCVAKFIAEQQAKFRAAASCLQMALLDLWGEITEQTVSSIIFGPTLPLHPCYSFYAVSIDEQHKMVQNAREALSYTSYIKLKVGQDAEAAFRLLQELIQSKVGYRYIIDCNTAWTISIWEKFMSLVDFLPEAQKRQLMEVLLYVEQPFGTFLSQAQKQDWRRVKEVSPFKIVLDEGFSDECQIQDAKLLAHGVNVKLEKTGGIIQAFRTACNAKKQGLEVMIGSMVSSQICCSGAFQLSPLVRYCDLDGPLLLASPQIEGGFQWRENGRLVPVLAPGLGLIGLKRLQQ